MLWLTFQSRELQIQTDFGSLTSFWSDCEDLGSSLPVFIPRHSCESPWPSYRKVCADPTRVCPEAPVPSSVTASHSKQPEITPVLFPAKAKSPEKQHLGEKGTAASIWHLNFFFWKVLKCLKDTDGNSTAHP